MNRADFRAEDNIDRMREAIAQIRHYVAGLSGGDFAANRMVQDAVIRNIEIIGEAAGNIARRHPQFAAAHPQIPWSRIHLMRDRLSHGYAMVDMDMVWETVRRDIPKLGKRLGQLALRRDQG